MVILKILAVIGFIFIEYIMARDLYKYYKKGKASRYDLWWFYSDIVFLVFVAAGGAYLLKLNKYIWESLLIIGFVFYFIFSNILSFVTPLINYKKKKSGIILSTFLLLFGLIFWALEVFTFSGSDPFLPATVWLPGAIGLIYFVFFCKEEKA